MKKEDKYPLLCLIGYIAAFLIGAIKPWYFQDWVLESILPVLFILILVFTYRKFRFSNITYTLILIFLILHTIGSHYTYVGMPFTKFVLEEIGISRNYYDRLVHFLFGLLFYFPIAEFYSKISRNKSKIMCYIAPVIIIVLLGFIFEVLEEIVNVLFEDPELVAAYLALQGESFLADSIKDMFMKLIGGILSMLFMLSRQNILGGGGLTKINRAKSFLRSKKFR